MYFFLVFDLHGVILCFVGTNVIGTGGSNSWENSGAGPHGYLRLAVSPDAVADELDRLLVAPPERGV